MELSFCMWILRVAAFSLRHADLFATGKYEFFTLGKKAMSRELGARASLAPQTDSRVV